MPMDRRITISFTTTTRYRASKAQTAATTRELWATRTDTGADRSLESGGVRGRSQRTYRIRYWPDLVAAVEAGETATVTERGSALAQTVVNVAEPDGTRRRFLDVTARGST